MHAFDPYEPVLTRFREMVSMNAIDNIVIHPVGLGSDDALTCGGYGAQYRGWRTL